MMEKLEGNSSSISTTSSLKNEISNSIDFIKETKLLVAHKSEHERFQIAKLHVFNALDFKKLRLDLELPEVSKSIKYVYSFQTNLNWKSFLLIISYVFMYASFFGHGHIHPSTGLLVLEMILLVIYMLDIMMEVYHKSLKTRLSITKFHSRFFIRVVTISLLFIDTIISLSTQSLPIRPFLILRCSTFIIKELVLPVMYDQQMRKLVYALLSSYIDIFVYALFYVTVIICFAVMANQFIEIPEGTDYDAFVQNYGDLPRAIYLMYILTTFDAYPDNQLVGIKLHLWLYGFFIAFIFLNALFFVTIPANVLFNSIIETRSKSVIIDEIEQQNNLIMAFITLGGDMKISIPYDKVIRFLLFVFNNEAKYMGKIMEICKALDEKVNGSIEVNEFMQICKIIQSNSYLRPPRFLTWKKIKRFESYIHDKTKFKLLLNSSEFHIIIGILIILTFINCLLNLYSEIKIFDILDDVLLFVYIVEVLFRLAALGIDEFFIGYWNTIDSLVITIGFVLQVTTTDSISNNVAVFIKMVRIIRISKLVEIVGDYFELSFKNQVFTKLAELMNQMVTIIPIIMKFFPLYLISFYFLGVIGVQIFYYEADIPSELSPYNGYFEFSNFKTLLGTHFIFVQVLTEAGWSMVAADYAFRYGAYVTTMLFFIICHQVIVIILTSLMKGVTWEVYNTIHHEHEDFKKKKIEEELESKALKKRLEIFEEIKEKIEKHEYILPDNLVTRELYEKKIDQEILSKLTELEMAKGSFIHKKRSSSKDSKSKIIEPIPLYKNILMNNNNAISSKTIQRQISENQASSPNSLLEVPRIRSNKGRMSISRKSMVLGNTSPVEQDSERDMDVVLQDESESTVEIEDLKEEDIEKEIDGVLSQVELHSGIKFSVKIEYTPNFLEFLKQKLKPLRLSNFKLDFDINNDMFAKKDSLELMVHGLQTLLEMETTEREQKGQILKIMIKKGLISEEKALKMLTEKSEFDSDITFDYNWIIRKTYLEKLNETKVTQFEIEYFSSIYGKSFKDINKITVYPLLKLESKLSYCFSNLLRYREITTHEFFNTLNHIENKVSTKLFQTGSLFKFVFQINTNSDTWFSVELKNSNELRVHFIKNGVWMCHDELKKDDFYVAKDAFNWQGILERNDREECEGNIKKLYQTFESLSFCIEDFNKFFVPCPELETYDLYTFYRDVEPCKRYVNKQLSISKIMMVLLSKEDERDDPIPYSLTDIKYDDEEIENYKKSKQKNIKLDEKESEMFEKLIDFEVEEEELISDREGLPYSYVINFLTGIKESMMLNEKNFVYHVERLLNQHFKENEKMLCSTKYPKKFGAVAGTTV